VEPASGEVSTPKRRYRRLSGSAITGNSRSTSWYASSEADDEWNTTTSAIPAATMSSERRAISPAARMFLRGVTLPSATRIALVVGTWLSFMNQGRLILDGRPPWIRIALNYLTPFTVASLGYLAARRHRNVERLIALLPPDPPDAKT
jgi:hypothetical protein